MWHWVCAINICTIQPNRKGLPRPLHPGLAQLELPDTPVEG